MKTKYFKVLLIILSLCFLEACFLKKSDSSFSILFIDVGQGDAALVECDGHYMLIDGGPQRRDKKVRNVLEEKGITKLDILVISHLHEDHYGGLIDALKYATSIKRTICNSEKPSRNDTSEDNDPQAFKDFESELSKNGTAISIPRTGEKYKLGSAEVEVVDVRNDHLNDSLVLMITYGKTRFLFTGDIERIQQRDIAEEYLNRNVEVDVIKMPHHGSGKDGSLNGFISAFKPKKAVISVGKNNRYGHPDIETLEMLEQAECDVYRTDEVGNILVGSNGKEIFVETNVQ